MAADSLIVAQLVGLALSILEGDRCVRLKNTSLRAAIAAISISAAQASSAGPTGLPPGSPVSEAYRGEFATCDRTNVFHGVRRVPPHACRTDPSRLERLDRIPATADRPGAIVFVSKLAEDLDGSAFACTTPGHTDQCATSLMLQPTPVTPCPRAAGARPPCVPIDADRIAYVAIPAAGPASIKPREFRDLTGIGFGDFGVVLLNGKVVPVIVADGGPANKIGEGSRALLKLLSSDGKPRTVGSGVTFVLFPKSAAHLTVDNLDMQVKTRGLELYRRRIGAAR